MQKPDTGLWRRLPSAATSWVGFWVSRRVRRGSSGQGMVEYSLILLLVALAIFVIFVTLGHRVSDLYSNINNGLNTAAG
ncbi:MAG: hypothetical protein ABSF27_00890 [Candidatus Dormibacteria bacterium]|jgi:Flp pilus assembly pilin Flp